MHPFVFTDEVFIVLDEKEHDNKRKLELFPNIGSTREVFEPFEKILWIQLKS